MFEGGLTNCLVGVKYGEEEDMLLVRVYGRNTEKFINRESEIKNLVYLNKHIGTPPVYAHFDNGLCYGYAKGRQLELYEVRDEVMGRRIARQMARMHSLPLPDEDLKQPLLFSSFLNTWLDEIPKALETEARTARMKKLIGSVEELRRECDELKNHLDRLNSPVVLCHNDVQYRNMIYSLDEDSVTFVDLEFAGPNFRGFDLGDFFYGLAGFDTADFNTDKSSSVDYQLTWLRMYLEETFILRGGNPITVTDEMVEDLYMEASQFLLACYLMWGIYGLIQAGSSQIDFDYLTYSEQRIGEYRSRKEVFLSIAKPTRKNLR
ncbi:probable ethanolamine kinase isoform X2 [Dysidea avara]